MISTRNRAVALVTSVLFTTGVLATVQLQTADAASRPPYGCFTGTTFVPKAGAAPKPCTGDQIDRARTYYQKEKVQSGSKKVQALSPGQKKARNAQSGVDKAAQIFRDQQNRRAAALREYRSLTPTVRANANNKCPRGYLPPNQNGNCFRDLKTLEKLHGVT